MKLFPDDDASEKWFIKQRWPDGIECPHCHSHNIQEKAKHPTMRHRCRKCRKFFSVRTGTLMQATRLGYEKWAIAIYLMTTGIKGTSSMKLHRDLGITQKSAWYLAHRIRESWEDSQNEFAGPVEADETYYGGKRKNMSNAKRKVLTGRGTVGKTPVIGMKDRESNHVAAKVAQNVDGPTVHEFVKSKAKDGAKLYTDESTAYSGLDRETVKHSISEYVKGQAHTNGMESFWALLKRGFYGTYHRLSPKHLNRYVKEFSGRHNDRPADTLDQMEAMAKGLCNKTLPYKELIK